MLVYSFLIVSLDYLIRGFFFFFFFLVSNANDNFIRVFVGFRMSFSKSLFLLSFLPQSLLSNSLNINIYISIPFFAVTFCCSSSIVRNNLIWDHRWFLLSLCATPFLTMLVRIIFLETLFATREKVCSRKPDEEE